MKVLLTGATGFIGLSVAKALCHQGLTARLMARRPLRGAFIKDLAAEFVQADLDSPKSLARAVAGADAVIHLAGRATFERYHLVAPSIVDGSLALARAAADAGVGAFVFASSLLVYGDNDAPVDAATLPAPRLDYGRAKLEAEGRLAEACAGMRFCAPRLPHVYGARDLLFHNVRLGHTISPGLGHNPFARLHVEDCARILVACARHGNCGPMPVADDFSATWNEFFDVVRDYAPRLREVRLPPAVATLGTRCLELWARLRGQPTIHTPDAVTGWNLRIPVAPGLLWPQLDLTLEYSTIFEGIPAVLDDCVAFRWVHSKHDRC